MGIRSGIFFVVLMVIACVSSKPSELDQPATNNCPVVCNADNDCCEAGGCYLAVCTICRVVGVSCQSDGQCCDRGGCYLNHCVACRALGVSCQSDAQCCNGRRCNGLNRCSNL